MAKQSIEFCIRQNEIDNVFLVPTLTIIVRINKLFVSFVNCLITFNYFYFINGCDEKR